VTVVIVNWNSLAQLQVSVEAVRKFSPTGTKIIVVDNNSEDGSQSWLNRQDLKVLLLDRNVGHGAALDLGVLAARTEYIVTLDVDAFPIAFNWLETLTSLLVNAHVAGAHGGEVLDRLTPAPPEGWTKRSFVHPCCLAMRLERFVGRRHTFRQVRESGLDVGHLISVREEGHLGLVEPTSTIGPGALGTVFGEIVYHNFYGTRIRGDAVVDGLSGTQAQAAWDLAVDRYLSV